MSYSAEVVLRVIDSVFDADGFYERGGKHPPREHVEEDPGRAAASNPHSTMDALCEVMDVRNALKAAPRWALVILRDYATRPIGDMRTLHGPDWGERLHLACEEVAKIINE